MKQYSCLLLSVLLFAGCSPGPERVSRQGYVLGTVCSISAFGASESLLDSIFADLKDIEERMRATGDMSEIAEVNRQAGKEAVEVSDDTARLIQKADDVSALAPGSFDITIGPLVQLWGIGMKENPTVPDENEIEALLPLIDYSMIQIEGNNVFLPKEGMGIDLGGIAKGYAADRARTILLEHGVESALIDFGGNILTLGRKPDGGLWRIGIQDPSRSRGQYIGIVELEDAAAVTSGPYERFFIEDGIRYHHILDPKTGYPADSGVISVSVITPESVLGDALSTMTYILGLEQIPRLLKNFPDTGIIAVTGEKDVYISSSLHGHFRLTDTSYTLKTLSE